MKKSFLLLMVISFIGVMTVNAAHATCTDISGNWNVKLSCVSYDPSTNTFGESSQVSGVMDVTKQSGCIFQGNLSLPAANFDTAITGAMAGARVAITTNSVTIGGDLTTTVPVKIKFTAVNRDNLGGHMACSGTAVKQ